MRSQEPEGAADAAEHAKRQHIDLQQPKRIQIILVPFDDRAPLHRRRADRAEMIQPPAGDDKAADML